MQTLIENTSIRSRVLIKLQLVAAYCLQHIESEFHEKDLTILKKYNNGTVPNEPVSHLYKGSSGLAVVEFPQNSNLQQPNFELT